MHNNQSSYNCWTWIVALLLALALLWMLFTGRGPSSVCCAAPVEAAAPAMPAPAPVSESFGFNASCKEFSNTGDDKAYAWVANSESLKTLLCGGEELNASGDGKNVALTGVVDSEANKTKTGEDAQAFFGTSVAVDNQITVKVASPLQ